VLWSRCGPNRTVVVGDLKWLLDKTIMLGDVSRSIEMIDRAMCMLKRLLNLSFSHKTSLSPLAVGTLVKENLVSILT